MSREDYEQLSLSDCFKIENLPAETLARLQNGLLGEDFEAVLRHWLEAVNDLEDCRYFLLYPTAWMFLHMKSAGHFLPKFT